MDFKEQIKALTYNTILDSQTNANNNKQLVLEIHFDEGLQPHAVYSIYVYHDGLIADKLQFSFLGRALEIFNLITL